MKKKILVVGSKPNSKVPNFFSRKFMLQMVLASELKSIKKNLLILN